MNPPVDAVLPAGGRIGRGFAAEAGATMKALIRLGDATLLERAIFALRDSGSIGRIVVVGPVECQAAAGDADAFALEADSGPENIRRGLARLGVCDRALALTTDLPFIDADAIRPLLFHSPALKKVPRHSRLARHAGGGGGTPRHITL